MRPNKYFFIFFFLVLTSHVSSEDEFRRPPARSVIITPHKRSESDPQQVHISLVGQDHMRVSWVSDDDNMLSIVEYGTLSGKYEEKAVGEHTSYHYFFYKSSKIHHVKIGPLKPTTSYFYRCGGSGPEFSFKTPPSTLPIEFVVVGDLGQTEWTKATLTHIAAADYDVLLLPGDLSYADGLQPLWDSFGRLVEPLASRRPWMVAHGNHEIETLPFLRTHGFKSFNARWPMPYEDSGSTSNLYYSYDVVGVHVIMLGSYAEFDADSDQYAWLVKDLGRVDREATPWVVALVHAPWYNTNEAHRGEGESMRKSLEELLYRARVDVVFAGHVHAYERFTRIYNNKADPCGPVYITIGDGGNREGLAMKFDKPASPLSLYREPSFGHGRLRVLDGKRAHWTWQRNNDSNCFVADELWLESLSSTQACWRGQEQSSSSFNNKDEL